MTTRSPAGNIGAMTDAGASSDAELRRLIQHGRDREAADLALRRLDPPRHEGTSMDPRDQLRQILPLVTRLVADLDDDQLSSATPCAGFSVRGVLEHMIGGAGQFGAAFRGQTAGAGAAPPSDVVAAFPRAMEDLEAAVGSPGALERTIAAPFGDVPGETFARFVAMDGLVHGWDIATATGQPYEPPADVVAAVDAFARVALTADLRDGDTFADPVEAPAGASPLVQLVAFTGRRP
jgi:uncharacterized protein (TIGR03086 family)